MTENGLAMEHLCLDGCEGSQWCVCTPNASRGRWREGEKGERERRDAHFIPLFVFYECAAFPNCVSLNLLEKDGVSVLECVRKNRERVFVRDIVCVCVQSVFTDT